MKIAYPRNRSEQWSQPTGAEGYAVKGSTSEAEVSHKFS